MIKITGEGTAEMQKAADAAFELLSLEGDCVAEAEFTDCAEVRALNNRTRGIDRETDVLSFPALDEIRSFTYENYPFEYDDYNHGVMLGSVVICREISERQAEEFGHSVVREQTYLFVHGLLHLLGYDHEKEDNKKLMREAEEKIMTAIGIER